MFSIDASTELHVTTGSVLGRLVNHGYKGKRNAVMKVVTDYTGKPHLCLFSTSDVCCGDEILYDYGVKHLNFEIMVYFCVLLECSIHIRMMGL